MRNILKIFTIFLTLGFAGLAAGQTSEQEADNGEIVVTGTKTENKPTNDGGGGGEFVGTFNYSYSGSTTGGPPITTDRARVIPLPNVPGAYTVVITNPAYPNVVVEYWVAANGHTTKIVRENYQIP